MQLFKGRYSGMEKKANLRKNDVEEVSCSDFLGTKER
jgi:hypothetical protein